MKNQLESTGSTKEQTNKRYQFFAGIIVLWLIIFMGSAYLAKDYIDKTMLSVQQTNAMNVQGLESRLGVLSEEMKQIKELLQNTDQTLTSSDSTQKALRDKINELDKQLQALEKSLNVLKEAPDANR
ncbi:hypothetical protein [Desulfotomaculum sp. 1211_IL3151]|uniref:hypothetical protein n=1 Tax=Desulfotomaculum sp. 1211_IL3151 TaxID=3084055 RepID=UPI002FD8A7BB